MLGFFQKKNRDKNRETWIIAGLGNPGPEYSDSRHNCGFRAIDKLKEKIAPNEKELQKFKGKYLSCLYNDTKIILLKPETYMNNSGESINAAMHWFKTDESRLIVIYDDFDLPAGQIRIRSKGSAGTHNGMKSVLQYTDTDEFIRIRIGIGPKEKETDIIKFVLGNFPRDQKEQMDNAFDRAADAALVIIKSGVNVAMNQFNQASISQDSV